MDACWKVKLQRGYNTFSLLLFLRAVCSVDWNDLIEASTSDEVDPCFTSDSWCCGVVLHLKIAREKEKSVEFARSFLHGKL